MLTGLRMIAFLAAALVAATALALPSGGAERPKLRACYPGGVTAKCGRLAVPENRALPGGRTISLNVVVLPATVKRTAADPFVYLTGGPGGAAAQMAQGLQSVFSELNRTRDIVLVDQRGTGGSNPLLCPAPTGPIEGLDAGAAYVRACQSCARRRLHAVRHAAAMDDLDAVRAALGYRTINLYGVSYGATAAQVYLKRHPSSVRSVVLDGATLLSVPIFERWSSNAQRTLDQIAVRCAADRLCATAFPRWPEALRATILRLEAEPRRVIAAGETLTIDGDALANVVGNLSASDAGAARIPQLVDGAAAGTLAPVAREVIATRDEAAGRQVMRYSILCDEPWARAGLEAVAEDGAGSYLGHSFAADMAAWRAACSVFPRRTEAPAEWTDVRSNLPALVLVGGADPKDPIGNVAAIRQGMPRARLLVVPGLGHAIGEYGCLPHLVADFLRRGTASGLATGCIRQIRPAPFVLG